MISFQHVVNCIQPHKSLPFIATSGIDHDIKLWSPTAQTPTLLEDRGTVVSRNEKLLEEGDPIIIPAALVMQLLNSAF